MILYIVLLGLSFSIQGFFGPNEETIKKWDELLYSESSDRIKHHIKNHPDQIDYGLKRLNDLREAKENKFLDNKMGPEDLNHFVGGSLLSTVGAFALMLVFIAINDDRSFDTAFDVFAIWATGMLNLKGFELMSNSLGKKYSQDSIDRVKAMSYEALKAQEEMKSKK